MKNKGKNIFRRDFLKGLAAMPFMGYFAFGFKGNLTKEIQGGRDDYQNVLGIKELNVTNEKLLPPTGKSGNRLRFGLVGHGWRGVSLLRKFGYYHPDKIKMTSDGKLLEQILNWGPYEDLNVEFAGVCDTFDIHAKRGTEYISINEALFRGGEMKSKPAKIYPSYRELVASNEIDAIVIATPDHSHAQIAIAAAKAGKHVYLEKPMTHSIEEAVELKNTVKSTGVVFQLGHENRQQMSFKVARELYQKGSLGIVTMVEAFTNGNSPYSAWIR
jgi:predicted dehydrogenase